ncbi:MAG: hypothetical protein J6W41_00175 [Alphaproteobacteria bacterium]|nr:hypothetical protein [Alphaproteobacteria bacterium]
MKKILHKTTDFFKNNFKLIIGIAVLILVVGGFFLMQTKTTSLENSDLKTWTMSSIEAKMSTIQILTDNSPDAELIMKCVDKMSTFNDSGEFAVRDAIKLCNMGIKLQENN